MEVGEVEEGGGGRGVGEEWGVLGGGVREGWVLGVVLVLGL